MKPLNLAVANLKLCGLHCKCKWMSNSMKVLPYSTYWALPTHTSFSVPNYKSRSHWHWSHKLKVAYNFGRILSEFWPTSDFAFVMSIHRLDPTPPPLLFDCAVFFVLCVFIYCDMQIHCFLPAHISLTYHKPLFVELFTLQRCKYFVSCYLFIFILFFVSLYWWFALIQPSWLTGCYKQLPIRPW